MICLEAIEDRYPMLHSTMVGHFRAYQDLKRGILDGAEVDAKATVALELSGRIRILIDAGARHEIVDRSGRTAA